MSTLLRTTIRTITEQVYPFLTGEWSDDDYEKAVVDQLIMKIADGELNLNEREYVLDIAGRAACQRAGVEPTTVELDGMDPLVYIAAANVHRRNLTKSQKALCLAPLYPEP